MVSSLNESDFEWSQRYAIQYLKNAKDALKYAAGSDIVTEGNSTTKVYRKPKRGSELESLIKDVNSLIKRAKELKG